MVGADGEGKGRGRETENAQATKYSVTGIFSIFQSTDYRPQTQVQDPALPPTLQHVLSVLFFLHKQLNN